MVDKDTIKTTVRVDKQFAEKLDTNYPAATSLPAALLAAADDGVKFKTAVGNDLETYVAELVDEKLEESGATVAQVDD